MTSVEPCDWQNTTTDSYSYDENGNMTCQSENGKVCNQIYNAENRLYIVQLMHSGEACPTANTLADLSPTTAAWNFKYDEVVAVSALRVHQESQSFFESQVDILWIAELLQKSFPERRQVELDEFIEQGLGKHGRLPH